MSMRALTGVEPDNLVIVSGYEPSVKETLFLPGESVTQQHFRDECDINNIVKRYNATGLIRQIPGDPIYADFTQLPKDYHDALGRVIEAQEAFMRLSSNVRAQFDNDPAAFVEFAVDPANLDQMREWRLAPPAEVEVVDSSVQAPVTPQEGAKAPEA